MASPDRSDRSDGFDSRTPADAVRLTALATSGGRVVQAGHDVRITEVHHHAQVPDAVALVERVQPTAEAVGEVFVGRDAEVESVLGVLDPTHEASAMVVVSAVAGLAGIGKTALARVGAAEAVSRGWFPGGAVFADLNGYALQPEQRVRPHQMYGPLLHALQEGAADTVAPQHQAVQYHRLLDDLAERGRSVLLVLDNASTSEQIAALLPRSRRHRVLITSRHTLAVRGSRTLDLRTLAGADSLTLVRRQLEQLSSWDARLHDDRAGLERLCDLCGHLPLALHIATALLAGAPGLGPSELADELARAHSRLDVLDDGERAVRAAFDLSYRRLPADPARLFRLLPLNPGPHFGIETASRLLDLPTPEARPLLHELGRAHMIEHVGAGAWRQHDLIRDYAIELMASNGDDQQGPSDRLLNDYAVRATEAGQVLRGGRTAEESEPVRNALAWFDQELPNLQAAIGLGVTFDDADAALRILECFVHLHRHRGELGELAAVADRIADVASASTDAHSTPWALVGRAWELGARLSEHDTAARQLLDFDAGALRWSLVHDRHVARDQVIALWRTAQEVVDRSAGTEQLAVVPLLHEIARTASVAALDKFLVTAPLRNALRLARLHGDGLLEALTHLVKARHWVLQGRIVAALDRLDAALEPFTTSFADATADAARREHVCRLLTTTAFDVARTAVDQRERLSDLSGHLARAAHLSLTAWRALASPEQVATALTHFAELRHEAGHYAEATGLYEEAIGAYDSLLTGLDEEVVNAHESLKRRRYLGRTLVNLSAARAALDDHDSAVVAARRAAALFATDRDLSAVAQAKTLLAHSLLRLSRVQEAVTASTQAEDAAVAAGEPERQVSAGVAVALALKASGRRRDAKRAALRIVRLAQGIGDGSLYYPTFSRFRENGLLVDHW
ncbi:ATP-binding protein [Streptomyces sp. NPDC050803]|uniref:ATP-binding protein n=1 Tax=unclassified Streptomyces TaxID=2593676 RepID=UPI00343E0E07